MTQVVQANCPHCQNILRIPAEWLDQPMRCKFCKNTFEARARTSDTPLPDTAIAADQIDKPAVPVARGVSATAITSSPPMPAGASVATQPAPVMSAPVRRRSRGAFYLVAGCAVTLFVLAIPAVAVIVLAIGALGTSGWFSLDPNQDGIDLVAADRDRVDDVKDFVGKDIAVKDKNKKAKKDKDKKGGEGKDGNLLPRRALLISVNNYLYLNSVEHGRNRISLNGLADFVFSNPPLKIPQTQIFRLSDDGSTPHPTELSVIKNAIKDFLDTSRAQDRIIILFTGHATEIDKDAYLIPMSGRKEDPDTLLPLSWVYDQMAACKARQKLLMLDVYHFPPARGFELPGAGASDEGEMGEIFDKQLHDPPAGVQVWSSCITGQRSIEFEGGSVFLQALDQTLRAGHAFGFVEGQAPLPFDAGFVDKVNKKMKELLGKDFEQTSRLTGSPPAGGAAYDPAEPLAKAITLKQPPVPGGKSASYAEVNSILDEIRLVPAARRSHAGGTDRLLKAVNMPPFPAKVLNTYKPDDYRFIGELMKRHQSDPKGFAKQHPIRSVVLDAIDTLRKSDRITMRETLAGPIDPKQKTAFLKEQQEPGIMIFELEQVLGQMRTIAEEDMDKETSKRWRANFDYTQARLKARLVYIYEYSYILGQIRLDALPPLENGADGWRVGSRKKIQVTEPKAKQYAKEVAVAWRDMQKNYPDTPWAVLAYREGLISLGLEWRAKKE
jgi:hypothetical protein